MSEAKRLPRVSVITITFNQERYIAAALESIVGQQTNFPFEVVVADDGSTDKTSNIIRQYAERYPSLIRPILRSKNIGAIPNFFDALGKTRGQFIANCEGDDYWTDPEKLQRQVDFLESHPDYSFCFHPTRVFFEDKRLPDTIFPDPDGSKSFTLRRLVEANFMHTVSVMYRRQSYRHLNHAAFPTDWYLHLYHAQFGKIGFINRVMAAYRRHASGLWWEGHTNPQVFWKKFGLNELGIYREAQRMYGKRPGIRQAVEKGVNERLHNILQADSKTFIIAWQQYPEFVEPFLQELLSKSFIDQQQSQALETKEQELAKVRQEAEILGAALKETRQHLEAILTSKSWRMLSKLRSLIKGPTG